MPSVAIIAGIDRVAGFISSVDPSIFAGRQDILVFDDRTNPTEQAMKDLVAVVPTKYLKVVGAALVEMDQAEKDAIDSEIEAQRIADLRASASAIIDASTPEGAIQRAILLEQLEDRNTRIADQFNALLTWLGAQTSLTNRAQLTGFAMVKPTIDQVKTAVKDRVSGGFVDSGAAR